MNRRKKNLSVPTTVQSRKREKFHFYLDREHRMDLAFKRLLEVSKIDLYELQDRFEGHTFLFGSELNVAQYQPSLSRVLFHVEVGESYSPSCWMFHPSNMEEKKSDQVFDPDEWRNLCKECGGWKEGFNPEVVPEIWAQLPCDFIS